MVFDVMTRTVELQKRALAKEYEVLVENRSDPDSDNEFGSYQRGV